MNEFLSGIELYYTEPGNVSGNGLIVTGEDTHHIVNVMRHGEGDRIYVTDGAGKIYETNLASISKSEIEGQIVQIHEYANLLSNITFCLPRLKSADRFEFALEKCIELGITNFVVFQSSRTVAKGAKLERWNKIAKAAMKQSLRSYLPSIRYQEKFEGLNNLEGAKILFDQYAETHLNDYIPSIKNNTSQNYYLIFGPEGGLSDDELNPIEDAIRVKLADNRLRSETAVITAAALLTMLI